jgi:membrane protein
MNFKKIRAILKATFSEFGEDNVLRLSAALAYYAIFSIGPLLVIAVGLAGLAFGHQTVHREIHQQLQSMVGANSANTVDSMMAAQSHGTNLLMTVIGLVVLLSGAAGVFGALQDSLNTIWEVKSKSGIGIWGILRKRLVSFSMVLVIGFLLLVSLALTTFLNAVTGHLGNKLPMSEALAHVLNFAVSFGVISLLFAMIFKYLPDVHVSFRKVWVGAIGTALLFTIGKYLLALYLGRASTASSYGAAGSVVLLLMWVYYAAVILFLGAEFTQVYAKQTGVAPVPTQYAVPVTEEGRAQQGMSRHEYKPSKTDNRQRRPQTGPTRPSSPGEVIHENPARFLSAMFVAGFAAVLLLRFPLLRQGLKVYARLRA